MPISNVLLEIYAGKKHYLKAQIFLFFSEEKGKGTI